MDSSVARRVMEIGEEVVQNFLDRFNSTCPACCGEEKREDDADIGDVYSVDLGDHEYVRG